MSDDTKMLNGGEESLQDKLSELGVDDDTIDKIQSELGATEVTDLAELTVDDLRTIGMKPVQARKVVNALQAATSARTTDLAAAMERYLPAVPDDDAWLKSIQVGGILKIGEPTVRAALMAAIANRFDVFDLPAKLVAAMEAFAEQIEEPVNAEVFFGLRRQLIRRSYADVFAAIEGLDGTFVTEARKKRLFERIEQHLWPALFNFYELLEQWFQQYYTEGFPVAITAMAMRGQGAMPAFQAPPTGPLRDASASLADAINHVFAGTGIQVTAAIAYDAMQIRQALGDERLPALVGAPNREQMLKMMGVKVTATYARQEHDLTQFAMAAMQAQHQPTEGEVEFFVTLRGLGAQIIWGDLGGHSINPSRTAVRRDATGNPGIPRIDGSRL